MKKVLCLLIVLSMAVAASALTFKDVPEDHWAADSVYGLAKMGVTKGFPDGTFRGKQKLNRYETAVFLYKMAKVLDADELAQLKADVSALKRGGGGGLSGSYQADWKAGNLLAESGGTRGGVASYRLQLSTGAVLSNNADVLVNLDTMDRGFYNDTNGDLATQLLDIESNLKVDLDKLGFAEPVNLKITMGPGSVQHATDDTNVLPSEAGVVYERPDTGIMALTGLWDSDVGLGYYAIGHNDSGRVTTNNFVGTIGHDFAGVPIVDNLRLDIEGNHVSSGMFSSEIRDMRGNVAVVAPLGSKVEAAGTLGIGGGNSKSLMVKGEVALNDLWETGTVANIMASKVGSEFIDSDNFANEEFDFAGLDTFMRPLTNGTVNVGGEVVQTVSDDLKLVGRGDLRLTGDYKYNSTAGRLTAQGGVLYAVAPNTTVDASYRLFQDKATDDMSDVAAVGLLYEF